MTERVRSVLGRAGYELLRTGMAQGDYGIGAPRCASPLRTTSVLDASISAPPLSLGLKYLLIDVSGRIVEKPNREQVHVNILERPGVFKRKAESGGP